MQDKIRLGIIIVVIAILCLAIAMSIALKPVHTESQILKVESGDTARSIANKLHSLGLIRNRFVFVQLVRLSRSDRYLKKGTYVLEGKVSLLDTINKLRKGKSATIDLTFPEGWSMYRVLKRIDQSGLADYEELYKAATDTSLVRRLTGFNLNSLEGFLYPETYRFDIGYTPEQILAVQVNLFFQKVEQAGFDISDQESFYRKMILASIVEKEAVLVEEKPIIAAVFLNRLRLGMRMESCPTVDYILERRGIRRAVLTYQDTNINSPYNTYLVSGLPPTPICNPSINSLKAVQQPASHRYLYFFADKQGKNVFSTTYTEHIAKQQRYRRK